MAAAEATASGDHAEPQPDLYVKEAQVSGIVDRKVMTEKKKHKTQFSFVIFLVWSDGTTTTVWRSYQQFFEFQVQLLMAFPEEAGETGKKRVIPYLPGKKLFTRSDAKLASEREPQINEYVQKLSSLATKVSHCQLVTEFFTAKEGDPSFVESAATTVSYSKHGDAAAITSNKGFKSVPTKSDTDDEDDDGRMDDKGRMKKCNSSEALLTERERTVSQTVVEIHNVPQPPLEDKKDDTPAEESAPNVNTTSSTTDDKPAKETSEAAEPTESSKTDNVEAASEEERPDNEETA